MQLRNTDEQSLTALGVQASQMLDRRAYSELASLFGYALCSGRDPAEAIRADHLSAMASPYQADNQKPITVKYFKPNSTGLVAAVECLVPVSPSTEVLLSLIVTGSDDKHITIEAINGVIA